MHTNWKKLTGGLALALGVGGCGGVPVAPTRTDPAQVEASIEKSVDRLRALQIFDVGTLVLNLPAEATSCYGVPCPGSGWEKPFEDERARQAKRLSALADLGETIRLNQYLPPHTAAEAEAAAAALTSLAVVTVPALVTVEPQASAQCYNLPCASDVAAADAENAKRVTQAFGIADTARANGL